MTTTTRSGQSSATAATVFVSFELSDREWLLLGTTHLGARRVRRRVAAWAFPTVLEALVQMKRTLGVAADTPVRSCYEAGREGFAVHRFLTAHGVTTLVVDPTSLRVDRRARRVKTDRIDGEQLLTALLHWAAGDAQALRVVRVPTREEEAARHPQRELAALTAEKTRTTNQLRALLLTLGVRLPLTDRFLTRLPAARDWAGEPVPAALQARLTRIWERRLVIVDQIRALQRATHTAVANDTQLGAAQIRTLQQLRGIGWRTSVTWVAELGWRHFRNRREVGGYLGLGDAPYDSGTQTRAQGITKHGNRHARRVLIPVAWGWLRYQPTSALTQWFRRRFADGGERRRRIGIVALARRLAIALWRFVTQGVVPDGAVWKAAR